MDKIYPKVSIVTVVFNAKEYLKETITSVITQKISNIEYIIIDGLSTDGTVEIIKEFDTSISYWISEKDKGIYDAMNKAIEKASGEWILFLNAGDTFYSNDSIEKFLQDVNPDTELYNGAINFIDQSTNEGRIKVPYGLEKIWETIPCWHQASFIKTSLMKEYKYSLEYKIAGDHDFYLRCFNNNNKFQFTNNIIANMVAGGLHQQQAKLAYIESIKILAKYAPDINLIYKSVFYKSFILGNPVQNNLLFSRNFSILYTQLENIKNNYTTIVLYGYGSLGKTIELILKEKIKYITDKNVNVKNETTKFIELENLKNIEFDAVLIAVLGREDVIIDNILEFNIKSPKIITLDLSAT
jgi:glycosyltransferase involved in cell wall biosynthesis